MDLIHIIKPTHVCNLACNYCYNDDARKPMMSLGVLERVISETFDYARRVRPFTNVLFLWHGGEPTLAGIDFYRQAVAFQARHANGYPYDNSMQTNGILLNHDWVDFFIKETFRVSLSLDGPKDVNDGARADHRGQGSFEKVMAALNLLRGRGLNPGVVLTANRKTIGQEKAIWDFFASNKISFQIVELSKSGRARKNFADVGITPEQFGVIWCNLYDYWFSPSNPGIDCSSFRDKTKAMLSGLPFGCQGLYMCADSNISTDPLGDVYPCSTLSGNKDCCYGNLMEHSLAELMVSPVAATFRSRTSDSDCSTCQFYHVCHGGASSLFQVGNAPSTSPAVR